MYRIVADSSCDFTSYPEIDFRSVPLTLSTAERGFTDDCNLNVRDMMDYMTSYKGRCQTACPSVESWLETFEGAQELYVLTITSGLSGTYNSACLAANQFLENHPDVKMRVFDTKSTGPEMRLLMEKIVELKAQGKSFTEVCKEADAYLSTTRLFFSFQSLHNLAQNGRVNKVLASALGMLHISILGTATPEGVIEPIGKSRGENALIRSFVTISIDKKTAVITIETKAQDALICKTVADSVKERLQIFITNYRTNKSYLSKIYSNE